MSTRDKSKGMMIARSMAATGCTFEEAEACYQAIARQVFQPAVAIVAGMIAQKVRRELFGQDTISEN